MKHILLVLTTLFSSLVAQAQPNIFSFEKYDQASTEIINLKENIAFASAYCGQEAEIWGGHPDFQTPREAREHKQRLKYADTTFTRCMTLRMGRIVEPEKLNLNHFVVEFCISPTPTPLDSADCLQRAKHFVSSAEIATHIESCEVLVFGGVDKHLGNVNKEYAPRQNQLIACVSGRLLQ